jgi:(S)-ureidoglycine aminohydrolase
MQNLGGTRSSLKSDHLLHTPDAFIRTPLPGAEGVEFIVHAAPRLGAAFSWMTAEFARNGSLSPHQPGIQRFLNVLEVAVGLEFIGTRERIRAAEVSRAVVIEKRYLPVPATNLEVVRQTSPPEVFIGDESKVHSEALGGDEDLQVRHLMPDGANWDFAVNTMTYAPGAALSQVEIHVMEHGLLMLQGGGIYRLGDHWYPVSAGDFVWMAPYCPQWFGALGKTPAKYLIYKDWYRHPIAPGA